ncbi:MAG TPA: DUF2851 family protein, partial [Flavisolibacter sp.]|nr:DUF2851 family protein [Flavisolibacter sp.]
NASSFIPCGTSASSVKELVWASWKERLLVERLSRKATHIFSLLEKSNSHWEEVLWWLLARNFGMKVNADVFEALAMSVPVAVLAKHKHSLHQIEALLLGQAGLLNNDFTDDYPRMLQREYQYLQQKFGFKPIAFTLQFLRMRPGNFPTIRLAQLAVLVQQSEHLFSSIVEAKELEEVKKLFLVQANDFWHYHYTFQQLSAFKPKVLGTDAVDNIIINTVVPLLFAYGLSHGEQSYKDKALRWLEEITAEKNVVTRGFAEAGVKAGSAFDSQALIELKNEYCAAKKCLSCAVGNYLLRNESADRAGASPSLSENRQ